MPTNFNRWNCGALSRKRSFRLSGQMAPMGRERPIRHPTTMKRHIALHQAGIGHNPTFVSNL
jgi:hypothetical protein